MENNATASECCPEFNPLPWDNKYFEWDNKKFIKDKVCTFFYMPINFGKVMKKLSQKVEKVSAEVPEWLWSFNCLCQLISQLFVVHGFNKFLNNPERVP